ncbi:TonB-dependent receptor [Aureispira anguillae]|uniref:TonB-dependent receptor n=1 Tax=Aureispira anguillae TaxID=2864201 RepID=A0A916DST9_9BACT|nr:TonB-dependent receptor [Aureispira anguillae]BDS11365.1 TonB-dependent receptor [Aureispira anguillae]
MKNIYIILIFFLSTSVAFSWTEISGNIRGLVTNHESGQIIRGATIKLIPFKGKKEETKSFSQDAGEFLFANVKPGLYNLECTAFGFKTTRIIGIQVREDRTKLAYFKLVRGSAAEVTEIYTYAALEAKQNEATATGSSTQESIKDAPATIYVITAEDIEDRGYMGINELLLDIPEIEIQNRSNSEDYNTISSRGIYGNEKILVLVDGIRYNSMVSTIYALLENYNIRYAERVEVILGPASALYGADAYMGVINIITKKGIKAKGAALTGSYGLYNTTSNAFQFGVGNEEISFAMSGGFYYSDGVNLNDHYRDEFRFYNNSYLTNGQVLNSPFDPRGSTRTLPIEPFNMSRFSYFIQGKFRYKRLSIGVFHNQEQHSSSVSTRAQYSPYLKESKFGSSLSGLNVEHKYIPKNSKKWSLNTLFNATFMFLPTNTRFLNTFSSYKDAYKAGTDMGARLTETFNYQFNKYHKFAAGITLQHSLTLPKSSDIPTRQAIFIPMRLTSSVERDIYYLGTNYTDVDGNSLKIYQDLYYIRRIILGAFAEYRVNIKDKLLMTLGLRFDQIIDISEFAADKHKKAYNSINPRLGLVYKPIDNLTFKLFYGEGFLQPPPQRKYDHFGAFYPITDNNGKYTHIQGGFWRVPNEDLLPEKVRTIELSTKYTKEDFSLSANAYANFIQNAIVFETDFDNPTFKGVPIRVAEQAVNSTELIHTYGATLRADYQFVFGREEQTKLKVHASYSYVDGAIHGLERLPFTANHTFKAGVLFKFHDFSLNNSIIYRSATFNTGYTDIDGNFAQYGNAPFAIWNLFAKYKILKKAKTKLNVFVKVNNVLNNKYYHTTGNSAISLGASPQDPIRFVGGLSISFGK